MGSVKAIIAEAQLNLERDAEAAADALIAELQAVHDKHAGKKDELVEVHVQSVFRKLAGVV